jgi:hypothetical protein
MWMLQLFLTTDIKCYFCSGVCINSVISLLLGWITCIIDFCNVFVQAVLSSPVVIRLPKGLRSNKGSKTCFRLKKSI